MPKRKDDVNSELRNESLKQIQMLTQPFQIRTAYYAWNSNRNKVKKFHVINCQALVDQLLLGAKAAAPSEVGRRAPITESVVPPLDHIDALSFIDKDSKGLLIGYGIEPRRHLKLRLPQVSVMIWQAEDCAGSLCDVNLRCQLHFACAHVEKWYATAVRSIGLEISNLTREPT